MSEKPKLCLITLGCKANQYDSSALLGYLKDNFILVSPGEELPADIYIINTCTVTHRADFDARQWINKAKRWNPNAQVVITGCLAEANPIALKGTNFDLIFKANEKDKLVKKLCGKEPDIPKDFFYHPQAGLQTRSRAFLKIQEGCNYRCSYCIVPYARGKSRSLPLESVFSQLTALSEQGFGEVVLCGINLGEWGKDIGSELAELLEKIEKAGFPGRIRLSSLEPMTISQRLIETIAGSKLICPHLHLPMQSLDNEILKRMKRPYSREQFLRLCQELFSKIPELCLGLDVLVGFPGENQLQFENTYRTIQELLFGYLHIFSFSPRPLTPAQKFKPKVPERIIKPRIIQLSELNQKRKRDFALSQLGKKMEIVIEDRDKEWGMGYSQNYLYLKAKTRAGIRKRVRVKLVKITEAELIGEEYNG